MDQYKEWIIQYHGNLQEVLQGTDTMFDIINERYAIIKTREKEVYYLKELRQIEYVEASRPMHQVDQELNLDQTLLGEKEEQELSGKGVTVGWISHKKNINYNNYKTHDGKNRIHRMHDGTKEYTEKQIIHMKSKNKSYESMDACVGNKGMLPDSQIIVVNWLKEEFSAADLIRAVRFVITRSNPKEKPLVIYLPFDISTDNGRNNDMIREIISDLSLWGKTIIVSNLETGSQFLEKNLSLNRGPILSTNGVGAVAKLALLMAWGIVKKNDPFLYGQKLRTYYIKTMATSVKDNNGFRTLDLAYALAPENTEIDAFIVYNNVEGKAIIQTPKTASLFPLVSPYIGVRGTIEGIKELLEDYPQTLITGSLAYILGSEVLDAKATSFKDASIFNTPTDIKGANTLIGIIGTGIDYTHPVFIDAQGKTRIVGIWDQTIEGESPYGYGTVYSEDLINEALESPDPFYVVPHKDVWGNGTMIAGIAAGYSKTPERTYKGVAPEASIVVVKLQPATADMQEIYHGQYNPLGFSALDVARGFEYLSIVANQYKRPISICLAMGTNSGPHDGTGILDAIIMSYAEKPGLSVVLPAGEEANKGHHASGNLKEKIEQEIKLTIPQGQEGFMTEIWATFGDRIEVSLTPPKVDLVQNTLTILNKAGRYKITTDCFVWSQGSKIDTDTGSQVIRFRLETPIPGEWVIKVKGIVVFEGRYDIWIPKTGMILPRTVLSPADPFTTTYNTSTSRGLITVACYDKRSSSPTASSGRGFARDGQVKPDFMVAGMDIPGPLPGNKWASATGTAIASAITVGVTSVIYENQYLMKQEFANTITMKALLIEEVKRDETLVYPDPSRGYGLLDISTVVYD